MGPNSSIDSSMSRKDFFLLQPEICLHRIDERTTDASAAAPLETREVLRQRYQSVAQEAMQNHAVVKLQHLNRSDLMSLAAKENLTLELPVEGVQDLKLQAKDLFSTNKIPSDKRLQSNEQGNSAPSTLATLFSEPLFRCTRCNFVTSTSSSFRRHTAHHTGIGFLRCQYCNYKSFHRHLMKIHTAKHTGEGSLACLYCEFTSAGRENHKRHLLLHIKKHEAPGEALPEFNLRWADEKRRRKAAAKLKKGHLPTCHDKQTDEEKSYGQFPKDCTEKMPSLSHSFKTSEEYFMSLYPTTLYPLPSAWSSGALQNFELMGFNSVCQSSVLSAVPELQAAMPHLSGVVGYSGIPHTPESIPMETAMLHHSGVVGGSGIPLIPESIPMETAMLHRSGVVGGSDISRVTDFIPMEAALPYLKGVVGSPIITPVPEVTIELEGSDASYVPELTTLQAAVPYY